MTWAIPSLRQRRQQVRDAIAATLPGADASVPNSVLRVVGDAQAALTHDNDLHLGWVARQMMPDTAEGAFLDRWASIWLPAGRKPAARARGLVTITGTAGASVATDLQLTATVYDATGAPRALTYRITEGRSLTGSSVVAPIEAIAPGAIGNLDEGARLAFTLPTAGIDGQATVAAPGLAGGADIETDRDLTARIIDRIQRPAHGGARTDYAQWVLEVPGVTRAWAVSESAGTVTVRIMLDGVRPNGLPLQEDLDLVQAYLVSLRPVTVADVYVVAPIPQPVDIVISSLVGDTAQTRAAIYVELSAMFRARAAPGQIVYASWIREAISAATGEDHHDITIDNVVPTSLGHLPTLGSVAVT
jgi:uncharacterized phage protein gp47/JayE